MKRREVTDSMVQRFVEAVYVVPTNCTVEQFVKYRKALEAALNPSEPEIAVNKEMVLAGADILCEALDLGENEALEPKPFFALEKIYRAMRALEKASSPQPGDYRPHYRAGDPHTYTHRRKHDDGRLNPGRRKDDR